eukprot:TRINITY_DN32_c0_g1_i1.p1 TRINITY_DN32_c0_g1~~TRINITY_DN32_c0_g1_i1.p1  ORF type:complete len:1693 (-),score=558.43 TRINITY_DN32_c0_g1_i1:161-5239(-)
MASGDFPDGMLSSSPAYPHTFHECDVKYARLSGSEGAGGFCPRRSNRDQYVEVDFGSKQVLTGVATQGRNPFSAKFRGAKEWVRAYRIKTSINGISWKWYNGAEILKGNNDGTNVVSHQLKPTEARYVRLYTFHWNNAPSLRFELYTAEKFSLPNPGKALGIANGDIKDAQITASSSWNCNGCCAPSNARLGTAKGAGAWCAASKKAQYIQVDLNGVATLTGITTQGRAGKSRQWVSEYYLEYSLDGNHWSYYRLANQVKKFRGNSDEDTKVTHVFVRPFRARFVRIRVSRFNNHPSMRFELYSRNGLEKPTIGLPAGMANKAIRDDQIYASTYYPTLSYDCHERFGRLNSTAGAGAWVAAQNTLGQFLEIDMGAVGYMTGVATQGRSKHAASFSGAANWVTAFKLAYSTDGQAWHMYALNGAVHVFHANYDQDTIVSHQFAQRVRGRYVRFYPTAWNNRIAMRAEVFTSHTLTRPATPPMIKITGRQLLASNYWGKGKCKGCATPNNGLLGNTKGAGAWVAARKGLHNYLEVDFGGPGIINGIATQGRYPNATVHAMKDQWVRSYKILYSLDGRRWFRYNEGSKTNFRANDEPNIKRFNFFKNPFKARLVRLYVTDWNNAIAMRAGFFSYTGIAPPKVGPTVGIQNGLVPAGNLYASSQFPTSDFACAPRYARLDGSRGAGGWQAGIDRKGEWITVDLGTTVVINGLATQGRNPQSEKYPNSEAWVKTYKLFYSKDGKVFHPYKEHDMVHIFRGNFDPVRTIYHTINQFEARYVRIVVNSWHGHAALRFDLFSAKPFKRPVLGKALGMSNGNIEDDQITAATEFSPCKGCCDAANARLNSARGAGSWCAKTNKGRQYLQVDLGSISEVQGISTQGRNPVGKVYRGAKQWVEEYMLSYSLDGKNWNSYKRGDKVYIFRGNSDPTTVVSHILPDYVKARFIRVIPTKFHSHISMRMELYGRMHVMRRFLGNPVGVGKLDESALTASSYYPTPNFACTPKYAVLDGHLGAGGWVARYARQGQWLQVDLGKSITITGVATQGRNPKSQFYRGTRNWVTKYSLRFSQDGVNWVESAQNFIGNYNPKSVVTHRLTSPVRARFVRFMPLEWHRSISMRVEIYTSDKGFRPVSFGRTLNLADTKKWPDQLFSSSSLRPRPARAFNARPNLGKGTSRGVGAWVGLARKNQWVQVFLQHTSRITGILVQGRALKSRIRPNRRQWATRFRVYYSNDGVSFKPIRDSRNKIMEFAGNSDPVTPVKTLFPRAIHARFVRIMVRAFYGAPAMRFDLYGTSNLKKGSLDESVPLAYKNRRASSSYKAAFSPKYSDLLVAKGAGAWCAKRARRGQWIETDLGRENHVYAIATQGRAYRNFWVKRYKLAYSLDGQHWTFVTRGRKVVQYRANYNGDSVVYQRIAKRDAFKARYVRLYPTSWNRHICMRFAVYGKLTDNAKQLGEIMKLTTDQYTSSSQWNSRTSAGMGKLFNTKFHGSWIARKNNRKQWIQMDFDTLTRVTGIATQGRKDRHQWVRTYKASCSPDGKNWEWITDKSGKTAIFRGNRDRNTVVSNALFAAQTCAKVRVYPITWNRHISMRVGLYGANTGVKVSSSTPSVGGSDDSASGSGSDAASGSSSSGASSSSSRSKLEKDEAKSAAAKKAEALKKAAAQKARNRISGEPDSWPKPKAKPGREGADHAVPVERKSL